ncbi:hypothetical protein PR003_g27170 [Phytophthora rubi]|uniref:Uncharacterized protein n=1 Tax=Phytophthora rubi TaxID=129364 RepID=A0A6A4C1U8_9STRA|nr:hypothetical protein PR003_g27170 [Phytophthora rubi]
MTIAPSPPCPRQVGGNAQVKPPSAVATAAATQGTQAPKAAVTIAAAPTRGVASAGKKPTASNKSASTNATAKATKPDANMYAKSTTPFAMNDVTAGSVHRARQICNTDFERLQQLSNFFVTNGEATARSPTFTRSRENRQPLLVLLIVSTTLINYGETSSSGVTASVRWTMNFSSMYNSNAAASSINLTRTGDRNEKKAKDFTKDSQLLS